MVAKLLVRNGWSSHTFRNNNNDNNNNTIVINNENNNNIGRGSHKQQPLHQKEHRAINKQKEANQQTRHAIHSPFVQE